MATEVVDVEEPRHMSDVTATLNPFGEHFLLDPYSSFELARQKSPVVYLPELDMMDTSDVLSPMAMEIIDSSFNHRALTPGRVYFLNTQKLGKDKLLTTNSENLAVLVDLPVGRSTLATPPGS